MNKIKARIKDGEGRAGDKLAHMAREGRIGMRGQRTVYGNWSRTERETQRIKNRAIRNAGF